MSNLPENPILSLTGWSQMPAHLVISLPKCGGNTIAATLRHTFPRHPVAYVHIISRLGLERAIDLWRPLLSEPAAQGHLNEAREARMMIEERRSQFGRPIGYYLCGVREPIGLAVSGFFQGYERHAKTEGKVTAEYVKHNLLNEHPVLTKKAFFQDGLGGWFDTEIKSVLGVDVFDHPFDKEKGYSVIWENGVKILVIRQQNFGNLEEALGEFYDLPSEFFAVRNVNMAKDKAFGDAYKSIKSELKFEDAVLDEFYDTRYCRHFFSEEEVAGFRKKWGYPKT